MRILACLHARATFLSRAPSARDVAKAKKMLEASLKWRATSGVEALTYDDVMRSESASGKMSRLRIRDR